MNSARPPCLARFSLCLGLFGPVLASAQQVPDAGSLLRQQPQLPVPQTAPPAAAPAQAMPPAPAGDNDGPAVQVRQIRFKGATQISESDLQAFVAPFIGQSLSFGQLHQVAMQLSGYYVGHDYLARVFVAPQDIADGRVTFTIVEGKLGELKLSLELTGGRVDRERARRIVAARLEAGQPLRLSQLGEAVAVLNQQPGVAVRATLEPGQGEGGVDVALSVADTPLVIGRAGLNNAGSSATGSIQGSATLALENPSGNFDAARLTGNSSRGTRYVGADYSLALGDSGLRGGVNFSRLDYRITDPAFVILDLSGKASTYGLYASYPLRLRSDEGLALRGELGHRALQDKSGGQGIGDRRIDVATLSVDGWQFAPWGMIGYGVALSSGRVDLSHDANSEIADQAGRRTQGNYAKLAWMLSNTAPLMTDWLLQARARGQFAGSNLDSSERLSLGGPDGVRAYPVGEAMGDDGGLLNLDLVRQFGDRFSGKLFVDYGWIKSNHATWAGWDVGTPGLDNRYHLAGAGVGMDWQPTAAVSLSASLAAPLGNNPARGAQNRDSAYRVWVGLNASF